MQEFRILHHHGLRFTEIREVGVWRSALYFALTCCFRSIYFIWRQQENRLGTAFAAWIALARQKARATL